MEHVIIFIGTMLGAMVGAVVDHFFQPHPSVHFIIGAITAVIVTKVLDIYRSRSTAQTIGMTADGGIVVQANGSSVSIDANGNVKINSAGDISGGNISK